MSEPPTTPAPRRGFRLMLLLLVPLLCLGASELLLTVGGLRIHHDRVRVDVARPSEIPGLGYELIPGSRGWAWRCKVRVNSLGLRGPEPRPASPEVHRVAVMGDSVTFGVMVGEDESYPAQLGKRLGKGHEVLNLGVTGYDVVQSVLAFEHRGLPLGVRTAVIGLCLNDVGIADEDPTARRRADRLHNAFPYPLRSYHFLVSGYELFYQARRFERLNRPEEFRRANRAWIRPLGPEDHELEELMKRAGSAHPVVQDWYTDPDKVGRLRGALERFSELCRDHGIRANVTILPLLDETDGRYPHQAVHQVVASEAGRAGLEVLDLAPLVMEHRPAALRAYRRDDIHPNRVGHELIARGIEAHLKGEPLPPQRIPEVMESLSAYWGAIRGKRR